MKKLIQICLILFISIGAHAQIENETPVAFPGAEGFGRFATGGRGGQVIFVTNLNDSGPGSLRTAIATPGPRIVIFKVSGIITLNSELRIQNDNITIAGQTAPGDGICLRNNTLRFDANNVIVRYIRSRMGDEGEQENDAMWGRQKSNIIIDHCTMSWSTDETGSFYDNTNFTMQWCILSESLRVSVHAKGNHGYGGIWGGKSASFHHNFLAHHDSRNPRMCGSRYSNQPALELVDFRNNVLYNWGGNSGYAGEGGSYNFVNNYYKPGPATSSSRRTQIFAPDPDNGGNSQPEGVHGVFYVEGNYMFGSAAVIEDNWLGINPNGGLSRDDVRSDTQFERGHITTHDAEAAFERVLAYAGASLSRDIHDERVSEEARTGTNTYLGSSTGTSKPGIIDTQEDVGGWPTYNSGTYPTDTDNDGMPDYWETAKGLNPDSANSAAYDLSTVYTNVEIYINSLVEVITVAQNTLGTPNYIDNFSDDPVAVLTKGGTGSLTQNVGVDSPIESFTFTWANADSAMAVGLPAGVTAVADVGSSTITISGTPTEPGTFQFSIVTLGGSQNDSENGTFVIAGPASLQQDNTASLTQTITLDETIETLEFSWSEADTVSITGLPEGLTVLVDVFAKTVRISGKPTETGTFDFIISTEGGSPNATVEGTIIVQSALGLDASQLDQISLYPNPSTHKQLTVETGKHMKLLGLKITNLSGQVVYFVDGLNGHLYSARHGLSSGIYFVTIHTDQGNGVKKLVVR